MDSRYFELGWLGYFVVATYLFQLLQIGLYPVPSAGSTFEMLFRRTASDAHSKQYLLNLEEISTGKKIMLIGATLAVIVVSLVPISVFCLPPVYGYLWPFFERPPEVLRAMSAIFLVAGNVITGVAVISLKRNVAFYRFGEARQLYTGSIFGFVRNPITLGLGLIYGGFLLALPSVAMIIGFVIFVLNSNRRVKMEEHYLARSFGDSYLQYRQMVGKYWPKRKQR